MATTHASARRHWFIAWSPCETSTNQIRDDKRLENQNAIKNGDAASFRIPHASATMRQNTDGWRELGQRAVERAFNLSLTNKAGATGEGGARGRNWPDCAYSRAQNRCIEFHIRPFSVCPAHMPI